MAVGSVRGDTFASFDGWSTDSDDEDFVISQGSDSSEQPLNLFMRQRELYDKLKNSLDPLTEKRKTDSTLKGLVSKYASSPADLRDSVKEVFSQLGKVLNLKNSPETSLELQEIKKEIETLKDDIEAEDEESSSVESDNESVFSDISSTEIERAEDIDQEHFNRSLKDRIISHLPNVSTAIMGVLFVGAALYYHGLPSEDQAKADGLYAGVQQGIQATNHALAYIEHFAGQNIRPLFIKNSNS